MQSNGMTQEQRDNAAEINRILHELDRLGDRLVELIDLDSMAQRVDPLDQTYNLHSVAKQLMLLSRLKNRLERIRQCSYGIESALIKVHRMGLDTPN